MAAPTEAESKTLDPLRKPWVVSTGDNFNPRGIDSTTDEMVAAAWRDVFPGPHPSLRVPWVGVPGNRDHSGNVSALAELAAVDPHWRVVGGKPRVVNLRIPGGKGGGRGIDNRNGSNESSQIRLMRFVYLDTTPLVYSPDDLSARFHFTPEDAMAAAAPEAATATRHWLSRTLTASPRPDWTVVIGHHPLVSSGAHHGRNADIRRRLKAVLQPELEAAAAPEERKRPPPSPPEPPYVLQATAAANASARVGGGSAEGRFDATAKATDHSSLESRPRLRGGGVVYFCGHEHHVQHAVVRGVHYVVSGAGSMVDEPGRRWGPGGRFSTGTHAFVAVTVSDDALTLTVVDYAGRFLYEAIIPPWAP
ncbi:hypothetical protein MMPV_004365 [Pyropia vietnamensis]